MAIPSSIQPGDAYANSVALTASGKILVPWRNGNVYQLLRLLPNGRLDPTFGTNAITDRRIEATTVVADGRIVVSGDFLTFAGAPRARLAWLSADGELLPDRALEISRSTIQADGEVRLTINSRRAAAAVVERSGDLQT